MHFFYDAQSRPAMVEFGGNAYTYVHNLQDDIVEIVDSAGALVVEYKYDAWGKPIARSSLTTAYEALGKLNPFRYRGYVWDEETGLYYTGKRYYSARYYRFLESDCVIANPGSIHGNNLYAYCFNAPVALIDPLGEWPKWLTGICNVVSGLCQAALGTALIAISPTVGGLSAIAGGLLVVDASATIAQGIGQIVNDVLRAPILREDNIVRTGVGSVGKTIAGEAGAQIAITTYDIVITASNLYMPAYATKKLLQQSGILAIKVPVPRVLNNPKDPFTQGLRAPGVVSNYCISIPQNGYGKIQVIPLPNGYYMLADGHHRMEALRSLGYKVVKLYITK